MLATVGETVAVIVLVSGSALYLARYTWRVVRGKRGGCCTTATCGRTSGPVVVGPRILSRSNPVDPGAEKGFSAQHDRRREPPTSNTSSTS